ncbi:coiled-coil alpha-helical rod protein 1 isoform X1 [Salmo trutta]|uniref:coiled-coil alpha-helical rod protein 1 isoform X1 n=1 Tax=Salmo trutta TaxID=8032 RepID=UPI001131A382|nr:coiled-coil alpha-helical rod protein 1-like isoform X1 [Salmo trutta]XP_029547258.1 coiled-coil alpha-helical rod protein 1-like isoform X1 [Salmo trutta]XP_029547259.1 coiled-coil alpha-helical rod protein 1-like isoform X1 [Salmo trutta]
MERCNEYEKLNAPSDFVASSVSKGSQRTLMPPSHFTASTQSASIIVPGTVTGQGTTPIKWVTHATTPPSDSGPANPWLTMAQAKQEILELHRENQRILMLQGDRSRGTKSTEDSAHSIARSGVRGEQASRWETEWRLDTERFRAESERLKGQVEALKEVAGKQREEMRDKETSLNRQSHEMEAMREELYKTKTELSQVSVELVQKREDKERLSTQLEMLERKSGEEAERLRREVERSRQETHRLTRQADTARMQAGEEAKQELQKLNKQLEESHRRHETQLQQLTATHDAELSTVRQTSSEVQERLCHLSQEVTHLKCCLLEVSAERDGLKEQLSQMGNAFETQSATLQSLRNYIGQLTPERGLEEKLTETIQTLNREKEALQVITELLTVRLNSVNDILALQEEEMTLSDPLLKAGSKATRVLRCWREKVFMLLVQLRSKDIELRGEKDKLLSTISSLEQEVKKEKYQSSVFQHSLQDRTAELELERVAREAMEQDVDTTKRENTELKSWSQEAEAGLRTMTEDAQRFSQAFEAKMSEVETVQTRLNSFGQRLTFAKRRVDTIQGLMMRKEALRRVQQATKAANPVSERAAVTELQAELASACEERDKLRQELKRTPELIESALADVREQFDSEVRQLRQAAERSRGEAQEAQAAREEAQQRLQEAHTQLEESNLNLEQLHAQLISQQEASDRALRERVSETEDHCAQQLRVMESQLNTARREHTKAVVALRQFERQAEREREQEREAQCLQSEHTKREILDLQKLLQEKDRDRNLLLATVRERGLMSEYKAARTTALQTSVALEEQQQRPSRKSNTLRAKDQPQTREQPQFVREWTLQDSLLSVLGDLRTLSAAVVHSSEDDAEEEGHGDRVRYSRTRGDDSLK